MAIFALLIYICLFNFSEMNAVNNINNREFGRLVFLLFDLDRSGQINFEEFLVASYSALSLTDVNLSALTFRLFDTDGSGELSRDEMRTLLHVVCGSNKRSNDSAERAMAKYDTNNDGHISLEEFQDMIYRSKVIMFPAFEIRNKLRQKSLGLRRWSQLTYTRSVKHGDRPSFSIIALSKIRRKNMEGTINRYKSAKPVSSPNLQETRRGSSENELLPDMHIKYRDPTGLKSGRKLSSSALAAALVSANADGCKSRKRNKANRVLPTPDATEGQIILNTSPLPVSEDRVEYVPRMDRLRAARDQGRLPVRRRSDVGTRRIRYNSAGKVITVREEGSVVDDADSRKAASLVPRLLRSAR